MKKTTRTSQAGFSLVELMVVVAIIGVLASIAVPAVNKYIAKARQSEAKTNLASLYTSEKAFYAEYTVYDPRFQAIGYSPEGQLRYNVGFQTNTAVANSSYGFNTTINNNAAKTQTYCGTGAAPGSSGCIMLNGATGAAVTADLNTAAVASATAFVGYAQARIHSSAQVADDVWNMDNNKKLTNSTNGIP